jgi:Abnormal spindle-like microcephaly-assoc'd, ASPM-SPD-2-Hydin/Protein of unknown function (DUF1573)
MKLTPILEGAGENAGVLSRSFSFPILLQAVAMILILSGMLVTSGCVGVAGKPGTVSGTSGLSIDVSPSTISFGSLTVGQSASKTLAITNTGTKSLTVSGVSVAGSGFTMKAISLPMSLAAGQSANVSTTFTAAASGAASGKIMVSSNAPNSPVIVALSATGVSKSSALTVSPPSVSFGDVGVGKESTQSVHLTNSGSSSMTISSVSASGSGISVAGLSFPVNLAAGASASLSATFKPASAGNASGTLTIVSNAANSPDAIGWSASATTAASPQLTVTPSSVSFGDVPTGATTTQTIRLTNSGDSPLTISSVSATGSGISVSGITMPLNVAAGQSANLTASLKPTSAGAASGAIKIASNATSSPEQVSWSATAQASVVTLTSSPATLSFGNVNVGTTDTLQATIKNTGNANANISKISVSGTGFSLNGSASSATLDPGQSLTLSVSFDPKAAGNGSGTLTIASNASTPQLGVALAGTGATKAPATSHSVALAWAASTSSVVGYYVYRSSKPSGPYARLNSAYTPNISYSDGSVSGGQTYYYVITAVNSSNIESTDSNQVSATIPAN